MVRERSDQLPQYERSDAFAGTAQLRTDSPETATDLHSDLGAERQDNPPLPPFTNKVDMKRWHDDEPPRRLRFLSHTLRDGTKVYRFKYADEQQAKDDLRNLPPEVLPYRLLHSAELFDDEVAEVAVQWAMHRLLRYGFVYGDVNRVGAHRMLLVDWPQWYDQTAEQVIRLASETYTPPIRIMQGGSYFMRKAEDRRTVRAAKDYFTEDAYAGLRLAYPERYGVKDGDKEIAERKAEQACQAHEQRYGSGRRTPTAKRGPYVPNPDNRFRTGK